MHCALSPGGGLRLKLAIRLRGQTVRSDSFWEIGCDFSAVTIRLRDYDAFCDEKWPNLLLAAEIPGDFVCGSKNR